MGVVDQIREENCTVSHSQCEDKAGKSWFYPDDSDMQIVQPEPRR